ncbi:class I SAM-dependent methyltransferase [Acetobacter thailandicus]|nr:class I SAM-dependent methyltransferase [Acetobacter thailandicus]
MPNTSSCKNWFDAGGGNYARFRPEYPLELVRFLAEIAPAHARAVDVGCGNGQLSALLATKFDEVVGLDPSADQIAHVTLHRHIRYLCAPAEALPLPDHSADLITAAQAAHWFNLTAFYSEVRRVATDGAVIALISYGVLQLDGLLGKRFDRFYRNEIGPYWPPERKLVDEGYRDLIFPFEERPVPKMMINRDWNLDEFLGYISTWSAVRRAKDAGKTNILTHFASDIANMWGIPATKRLVTWPINMRIGTL